MSGVVREMEMRERYLWTASLMRYPPFPPDTVYLDSSFSFHLEDPSLFTAIHK